MRCYLAGSFSLFWAMLFTYLGAQYLPSGLISLIYGLSPLVAGFFAHVVFKSQRLNFIQWAGMFIAVLGLAGIFGAAKMQGNIVVGIIYVLLGVLCYVGSIFGCVMKITERAESVYTLWLKQLDHCFCQASVYWF